MDHKYSLYFESVTQTFRRTTTSGNVWKRRKKERKKEKQEEENNKSAQKPVDGLDWTGLDGTGRDWTGLDWMRNLTEWSCFSSRESDLIQTRFQDRHFASLKHLVNILCVGCTCLVCKDKSLLIAR